MTRPLKVPIFLASHRSVRPIRDRTARWLVCFVEDQSICSRIKRRCKMSSSAVAIWLSTALLAALGSASAQQSIPPPPRPPDSGPSLEVHSEVRPG